MSTPAVSANRHILRALARWPKDTIRPQVQMQDVVGARYGYVPEGAAAQAQKGGKPVVSSPSAGSAPAAPLSEREKLGQANALFSLLGDRYKNKYPITGSLLTPKSNPTYYDDLMRELVEAPNRSWFNRVMLRLKGLIRLR